MKRCNKIMYREIIMSSDEIILNGTLNENTNIVRPWASIGKMFDSREFIII